MSPYIFWLIVAFFVLILQMINKLVQYKTSVNFWKQNAFIATEKYNDLLIKHSLNDVVNKVN
tara:strand:+ start:656 stop:841 length:186 start_codon:yes stop_codon:yes gene_type:complete